MAGAKKTAGKSIHHDGIDFDLLLKCFSGLVYQYATLDGGPVLLRGSIEEMTGYALGELQGVRDWEKVIYPDDAEAVRAAAAEALKEPVHPVDMRFRIVRKDGTIRWLRNVLVRMDGSDSPPAFQGIIYDVTSTVLSEMACHDRDEVLRGILRVAPAGIGVVVDRVFSEVNDRFCEMIGYSREELLGRSARMIYPTDEDYEYVGRVKYSQIAETGTGSVETRFRRSDGRILDILLSSTLLDAADPLKGVAFTAFDITAAKVAQRAVAENEKFLSSVFSSVQDGISVLDTDLRILQVNPTMERWYAHSMPLEGRFCYDAYHGAPAPCKVCPSRRSIENGLPQQDIVPLVGSDGSVSGWLDLFSFPMIDQATGEVTGVIEYVRDISARVRAETELRRERDLLRSIAEAGPAGIAVMNGTGEIEFVNARLAQIMGIPREGLVGRNCTRPGWQFRNPDGTPMASDRMAFNRAARTGLPVYGSLHLLEFEGGRRGLFSMNASPILDSAGRVERVVASIEDVTERHSAAEALRRSEQFSRALIDESPIGISVRSSTGRLLLYNKAWQRLWAMSDSDIRADMETEREALKLDQRDGYLRGWASEVIRVYTEGGVLHIPEAPTKAQKRGSAKWVSQHFYAIPDASGNVDRVVILTENITQRKTAELALRESEERYRALAEAAQDLIFVVDREDRILYVNSTGAASVGVEPSGLVGRHRSEVFSAPTSGHQADSLSRVFASGEPLYAESETDFPGGKLFLGTWLTPLRDSSGKVEAVLGVSRDITGQKLSEEKERSLQEQLAHAQRMESIGRLAGGVAHDFNNLLTVILGHLELLMADLPPHETPLRISLQEIQNAAGKAKDLTGQLLAFGRRQILVKKPLDLNEMVLGFAGILRRLIGEDIEVSTSLGEDMEPVSADPSQMEQVLMNLAVNARDAMPLGGRLAIATCSAAVREEQAEAVGILPGKYSLLSVGDTGTGMEAETAARIFEPFFTTKEVGRGTGLGLSTVYGIVKQHGGHVTVDSQPGRGSLFTVYLPVASTAEKSSEDVTPLHSIDEESRVVLVVEDDVSVRQLVCRMLRDAGFEAIECGEALQAPGMAEAAEKLDLVVTDVVMPGLSGSQVFQQISSIRPGVRVLFISGYTGDVLAQYGVSDRGVGFLQKPFTTQTFLRKVHEVLS